MAVASLQAEQGARYLIIAADGFVDALKPLADWKTQKGMLARIVPESVAGTSSGAVQSYIRNACETWPIAPEYVLIAGGPSYIPAFSGGHFKQLQVVDK